MMDQSDNEAENSPKPKKWVPRPLVTVCGVCGSPATDVQHYGATACYSCRYSFNNISYMHTYPSSMLIHILINTTSTFFIFIFILFFILFINITNLIFTCLVHFSSCQTYDTHPTFFTIIFSHLYFYIPPPQSFLPALHWNWEGI